MQEIVPIYNKYQAESREKRQPEVGDIVVALEKVDREKGWPISRIKEAIKSHDGRIRRVKIRIGGRDVERGVESIGLVLANHELP